VGRASNRKKRIAAGEADPVLERRIRRTVQGKELRARLLGDSQSAVEALSSSEPELTVEWLVSRHNQRMERCGQAHVTLHTRVWPVIGATFPLRAILRQVTEYVAAGGGREELGPWVTELEWGLDSVLATMRLAVCGQFLGAALVARGQLERWTANLAYNVDVRHRPGESEVQFTSRVWASADLSRLDEDSIRRLDPELPVVHARGQSFRRPGPQLHPSSATEPERGALDLSGAKGAGQVLGRLSEFLHGDLESDAVEWESPNLLAASGPDLTGVFTDIVTACGLSLERVSACAYTEALLAGLTAERPGIGSGLLVVQCGSSGFAGPAVWPLTSNKSKSIPPAAALNPPTGRSRRFCVGNAP